MPIVRSSDSAFLRGAFILTLAGMVAKVIGAISRIPLYSLLGSEGMGLFQMAYPMYSILLIVSTGGLSVAISKVLAEKMARGDPAGALASFRVAFALLSMSGLAFSTLLYLISPWIASYMARDPRAVLPIKAIAPALLLVAIMSAFRGFFQGLEEMGPVAVSGVLEQIGRLASMLSLAWALLPKGIHYAAAGASAGASIGALVGLVYLGAAYAFRRPGRERDGKRKPETPRSVVLLGELISVALPVSVASAVFGLNELIDLSLVPSRLRAAGIGPAESTMLYGRMSGGAFPLINLPTVFTGALGVSLVPSVAAASVRRDFPLVSRRVAKALTLTYALALPAALGLLVLAEPIPDLLYGEPAVGPVLRPMAPAVLFLALQQVSTAILQGLGHLLVPVVNLMWAALAKAVLTWFLVADPALAIKGASLATTAYFFIAACLNLTAIRRRVENIIEVGPFAAASVASAAMASSTGFVYRTLASQIAPKAATVGSIIWGMLVYGVLVLLTGVFKEEDLAAIPGAGPLAAGILRKLRRK
ncbi:MAG: polysaccharide biosynthesis protein [Firmicutes bacterium]|nr:polysaccharide biosynthesis protein [Candidatus Fermentithermobacillaceae bacterium]